MGLNVKKIEEHTGYKREKIAEIMGIKASELSDYEKGNKKISQRTLEELMGETGLAASDISTDKEVKHYSAKNIDPVNTWVHSRTVKKNLTEFIKEGSSEIDDNDVRAEIIKIESLLKNLRKPKVAFAGFSDVGKSTMINVLLGVEHMPAKYTPTTSIAVYIKHINDRPEFINENVWIFQYYRGEVWNDNWLCDEEYTKNFLLASGNYDILEQYGTHQDESSDLKKACAAVVFIDSPLLEVCDILDLPGFGSTEEDDALQKMNTQNSRTDILIYLSRANGFLSDRDKDYLKLCIDALNPIEKSGCNNIGKLENLFVIASQANAVDKGNFSILKEIMDKQCHNFCRTISGEQKTHDIFSERGKITGYLYNWKDLRTRFFTYEKDQKRLCSDFEKSFKSLTEKLPQVIYNDFWHELNALSDRSSTLIKNKISELKIYLPKTKHIKNYFEI